MERRTLDSFADHEAKYNMNMDPGQTDDCVDYILSFVQLLLVWRRSIRTIDGKELLILPE